MIRFLLPIGMIILTGCQINQHVATQEEFLAKQSHGSSKKIVQKTNDKSTNVNPGHDGPPPGPLPVKFKKVVPKSEPLSRYGNPDVYYVDGHTYEVMTSSSGYRTKGLASWYGTKFHKMRTSSGEKYDMYALTAAHKTLPIHCYVNVKHLDNGRTAIVKVNDRGPFHDGRVIDLSYAAAAKLGLFPKGTAHVEIEALTTTSPKGARPAHYYLQAGAFNSSQLAEALRIKLSKLTPSPVFIEKYQHRFIVRVGPFANRGMTDQLKRALVRNGVPGSFSVLI